MVLASRGFGENGDEIVFEGIQDPTRLACFIVLLYTILTVLSAGILLLFLPIIIVIIIIYCGLLNKWRLYITYSDLHHGCGYNMSTYSIIPFSEMSRFLWYPGKRTFWCTQSMAYIHRAIQIRSQDKRCGKLQSL